MTSAGSKGGPSIGGRIGGAGLVALAVLAATVATSFALHASAYEAGHATGQSFCFVLVLAGVAATWPNRGLVVGLAIVGVVIGVLSALVASGTRREVTSLDRTFPAEVSDGAGTWLVHEGSGARLPALVGFERAPELEAISAEALDDHSIVFSWQDGAHTVQWALSLHRAPMVGGEFEDFVGGIVEGMGEAGAPSEVVRLEAATARVHGELSGIHVVGRLDGFTGGSPHPRHWSSFVSVTGEDATSPEWTTWIESVRTH